MPSSQQRKIVMLLTPSASSGILAVAVGLLVFAGPVFFTHYGTYLNEGVSGTQQYLGTSQSAQTISNRLLANAIIGNVVVALLWAGIGCVVYFTGTSMVGKLHNAASATKLLRHAGKARNSFVQEVTVRLLVRIAALTAWWVVLRVLVYTLIPHGIAAAHSASLTPQSVATWLHSVLWATLCVLAMHALTIAFRLMLLRPRLGVAI